MKTIKLAALLLWRYETSLSVANEVLRLNSYQTLVSSGWRLEWSSFICPAWILNTLGPEIVGQTIVGQAIIGQAIVGLASAIVQLRGQQMLGWVESDASLISSGWRLEWSSFICSTSIKTLSNCGRSNCRQSKSKEFVLFVIVCPDFIKLKFETLFNKCSKQHVLFISCCYCPSVSYVLHIM